LGFLQLILDPRKSVDRITEEVSPLTRALHVQAMHTFSIPQASDVYYPATIQRKGSLIDVLSIRRLGEDCPVLSQRSAAAIAMRAIDSLATYNRGGDSALYPEDLRERAHRLIGGSINATFDGAGGEILSDVLTDYQRLLGDTNEFKAIEGALRILCFNYCHVILVNCDQNYATLNVEYRIMQDLRTRSSGYSGMRAFAMQAIMLMRFVAGAHPMRWSYSVSSAIRCSSYHLTVMGPSGTYLSRQKLMAKNPLGCTVSPSAVPGYLAYSRFRARLGQRYLHLYIRDAKTILARDHAAVFIGFFERPPGSVAVAATSSVASTILIIAAGYMQANGLKFNGDIVAVMLAFPFIVASGIGIDRNSGPLSRSVMLAKFGAFATACFSTIAAISVVGYQRFQFGEHFQLLGSSGSWLVLVFLSTLTSALMLGSWISRSALYYSFLTRDALADFNELEVAQD